MQLNVPSTFDAFMSGREARKAAEDEQKQRRFGDLISQSMEAKARGPLLAQAAQLDPERAMQFSQHYQKQDELAKNQADAEKKREAAMKLSRLDVFSKARPEDRLPMLKKFAPQEYDALVQHFGREPAPEEIEPLIGMYKAQLMGEAGMQPDIISERDKFEVESRENIAKINSSNRETARQRPPSGYQFTEDGGLAPIPGGPADKPKKPESDRVELPVGALRMVNEAQGAIDTAGESASLIERGLATLNSGKLNLGVAANAVSRAKNWAGMSSDASRAYSDVNQTLEKLRSNYLLLAKGVQTEGDAVRAWNSEIGENAQNDNELAKQQLTKAKNMIEQMTANQKSRIDMIYSNYGGQAQQPKGYAPGSSFKHSSGATIEIIE